MLSEGPSTAAPTPTRGGLGGLGPLERGRGWPRGRGGFRTPPEQGRSGGPTGEGWPALPEEPYSPSAPGTRALRRGRKRVSLPRETERGSRRRGARGEREDRFVSAGAGARLPGGGPARPARPLTRRARPVRGWCSLDKEARWPALSRVCLPRGTGRPTVGLGQTLLLEHPGGRSLGEHSAQPGTQSGEAGAPWAPSASLRGRSLG